MKRNFKIFALVIGLILITGCGTESNKEVVKKCTLTTNDVVNGYKLEAEYNIYGTGKVIDKVVTTETVISDDEDILDYFEENLDDTYSATNEAYGGYTNEITKEDGKLTSKTTIDYSVMNLDQYVKDNPSMRNYISSDNKLLIEGIVALYEQLGATCN